MIGIIVFCAMLVCFVVAAVLVHRREQEMDYPEAHGAGLSEQERAMVVLGANSAWAGNTSQL